MEALFKIHMSATKHFVEVVKKECLTLSCRICCTVYIHCMYISLWVFTQIYNWALQTAGVGGFYLSQPHGLPVFLVFPHSECLGHKSWGVLPAVPLIQLWLYFRMPSWSAAVPRTSTFPPPFPAAFCLMLGSFRVALLFPLSSSLLL